METPTTTTTNHNTNHNKLKSSSFRLRSPSLNSVRLRRIFDLFDTNHDELITVDELSRALILLGLDTNMNELDVLIKTFIQDGNTGLTFVDFQALHKEIDDLFFHLNDDNNDNDYKDGGVLNNNNNNNNDNNDNNNDNNDNNDNDNDDDDDNNDNDNDNDNDNEVGSCKQEEADLTDAFNVFDEDGDGFISAKELQTVLVKLGFAEGNEIKRVEMMISSVDRNHDGRVDFMEFKEMMRNVIVFK